MNILKYRFIHRLLINPVFISIIRFPFVVAFFLIIFSGLFGSIYRNSVNLMVGVIWLVFISFTAIIGGKIWCLVCPWNTLAEWMQYILRLPDAKFQVPRIFRNLWIAVFFFLLIIWLEYAIGLANNARFIAYLAIIIFGITFISVLLFPRKSFCRYGCPVGAICGLYGLFAPLELRSADKETCRQCLTKDCIKGNDKGNACPVFEYPGTMDDNLYCILCTECIKTCPNDNIAVNIRKPVADLLKFRVLSFSEIFMIVTMLALSIFGAMNISRIYFLIIDWSLAKLALPEIVSLLFLILILVLIILFLFYALSRIYRTNLSVVTYTFLPIALFNHLANTVKLFSIRAEEVIPLISDPLGLSWNLFGSAGYLPKPLFDAGTLQYIAGPVMIIGLLYSIYLAYRLVRMQSKSKAALVLLLMPMALLVWFNWWLIPQ
ncbi:MAG: 4Fe-4S binding protein [Planctomycetes bacterium]|nr:4Fe-4S binding protein [Planctomycetota bacterium]